MLTQQFHPKLDVAVGGTERDWGVAMGSELREKMQAAFSILPKIESFRAQQPWWMPFNYYRRWAQRRAQNVLEPGTRRWYPHMAERLHGMAEGAGIGIDLLYLFHMLEILQTPLDSPVPSFAGCSALAVGKHRSSLGEPVVMHNFDMLPVSRELFVMRQSGGAGRFRSIQFTLAPLGGAIDGMNEAGLCITYNLASICDSDLTCPPISFAIDHALSYCKSVPEAVSCIKASRRGNGAILMLADAEGCIASLELSSTRACCRSPRLRRDLLTHTNCFHSRALRRVEPNRSSLFAIGSPSALRGRSLFRSPMARQQRLNLLLRGHKKVSPEEMRWVMSDHGADGAGSDETVCMHGDHWSTIASVQLFPCSRRIRIAYQPTCRADYTDFVL